MLGFAKSVKILSRSILIQTLLYWTSLVAQTVKCLHAIWEMGVRSLAQEDPLEKEMATHWNACENPMPGKSHGWRRLVSYGVTKSQAQVSDFTLLDYHSMVDTLWSIKY